MRLVDWVATGVGAVSVSLSWNAAACSPDLCPADSVIPAQGSVPANLPALYWSTRASAFYGYGQPRTYDPSMLSVARVDTGETLPVTLSAANPGKAAIGFAGEPFFAVLSKPLVAGGHYRVDSTDSCAGADSTGADAGIGGAGPVGPSHRLADFTAGPSAPLPTSLGTLQAGPRVIKNLTVADVGGGCSASVRAAQIPIHLVLSADAKPWKNAFFYETLVDGAPYHPDRSLGYYALEPMPEPGASWVGRGKDVLFGLCKPSQTAAVPSQATEGQHTVVIHATIPGTKVDVSSASLRVTVDCKASSGGCSVVGPRDSGSAAWLALVPLVWVVRRRRRRDRNVR